MIIRLCHQRKGENDFPFKKINKWSIVHRPYFSKNKDWFRKYFYPFWSNIPLSVFNLWNTTEVTSSGWQGALIAFKTLEFNSVRLSQELKISFSFHFLKLSQRPNRKLNTSLKDTKQRKKKNHMQAFTPSPNKSCIQIWSKNSTTHHHNDWNDIEIYWNLHFILWMENSPLTSHFSLQPIPIQKDP